MLQYTIENGSGGCCGQIGAEADPQACATPPIVLALKPTPQEAKQMGQETWCETRGDMYMCLPRTLCAAGWFKALQRAVNAYIEQANGIAKIRVDARIGPETLQAVRAIAMANGMEPPADVNQLTVEHAKWTHQIAEWAGVPVNAAPDPKARTEMQQYVDSETARKAGLPEGKSWWSWGKWVVLAAMGVTAVGLGWSIYKKREEEKGIAPEEA